MGDRHRHRCGAAGRSDKPTAKKGRYRYLLLVLITLSVSAEATFDRTPPEISLIEPEANSFVSDQRAEVRFAVEEVGRTGLSRSGIDRSSRRLLVNGEDYTSDTYFVYTNLRRPWNHLDELLVGSDLYEVLRNFLPWLRRPDSGLIVLRPSQDRPLPEGELELRVQVADLAGNVGALDVAFSVDTLPPVIQAVSPAEGTTLSDLRAPLRYSIVDAGIGVNPEQVQVYVNGVERANWMSYTEGDLLLQPPEGDQWPEGELTSAIVAADLLGNRAQAEFHYAVALTPLRARPRAVPEVGYAPLQVRFFPDVDTDTAIEEYAWDFEGDGTFDRTEVIGRHQDFTYTTPGTYRAALRAEDSRGDMHIGYVTVEVKNAPPVVSAIAQPSNGEIPLTVHFRVEATDNEGIALYEWDYTGDGVYDYSGPYTDFSYVYDQVGSYSPRLRVTDVLGASTEYGAPIIDVRAAPVGAPNVVATATPSAGDGPLTVNFSGTASHPADEPVTEWAWDFNGDGSFEAVGELATVEYTYESPGIFYPRLRITTADGQQAEDVLAITVRMETALSVSDDTIDLALEETATVSTTLGAAARASLVIENSQGQVVRTLVPWSHRAAGAYQDAWDGRDDQGAAVPEGPYYAILLYETGDQVHRHDLGQTTGNREFNPPRSSVPSSFQPFGDNPLEITFTLNEAAEVTAFMGRFRVNTRLVTFMQRQPLGRGSHTITWYGTDSDGRLIRPREAIDSCSVFSHSPCRTTRFTYAAVRMSAVCVRLSLFSALVQSRNCSWISI
ncbi:hypothetical protein CAI21_07855 [Alkalilimnicola ehrlichii]|uniref:PKD domain-containing protein n=1 Tax=Alkalilimnicola ehrlichii TaxID=351052 RepID=A0A3E0WWV3_9GAMM|nr:PKD domain-containing protein [Alkalilimnicola ehrlichii]RFA30106.1 hypothetical protein CAI21_07855 [Alkalilimnicola ehrlichii]RFA37452.1 hypothetical protein CAL65_09200 [Alkalilimnicola ehrlichii]